MKLWRFKAARGLQPPRLRENVYMAPTFRRETKCDLTWARGPMQSPRGLYGEVALRINLAHCKTSWPSRALSNVGAQVAKYALDCCSVAPATR